MSDRSLIDELLADQQSLTAVEKFSRAHDALAPGARSYRDLIPLEAPRTGEQYAFEVELDKCSGCKACVTACHSLNGLDDNETWREVGLLITPPKRQGWHGRLENGGCEVEPLALRAVENPISFQQPTNRLAARGIPPVPGITLQHVTTACHHCVDPACLNGCPVLAYEKDPVTGIVRHLDDQCIGCQYCVLKCPYDVPKYNARLGIVRKCDMCSSRLAVGEAPACVQACPNEAIRITKVSTSAVTIEFRERGKNFLSSAPAGGYTLPTTRYVGVAAPRQSAADLSAENMAALARDAATGLIAADVSELKVQPAHWPLAIMLVLSQASVGVITLAALLKLVSLPMLLLSLALIVVGLGASIFHLGRPLGAWRAFLNLRRSWMSREIVVFGMFPPLLIGALALALGTPASSPARFFSVLRAGLEAGAPLIGLLGVFCSAMIYHDTQRPLWHWRRSVLLFFGTAVVLGAAGAAMIQPSSTLAGIVIVSVLLKLAGEISVLRHGMDLELTPLKKTALLITGKFQPLTMVRLACAMLGGLCLPLLFTMHFAPVPRVLTVAAFGLLLAGELIERFFYFTTVAAAKMPGGLPT